MAYPLVFNMGRYIPGFNSSDEPFAVISELWLFKYCQQKGLDLKKCDFTAYPFGVNLRDYTGSSYLWESIKKGLTFLTNHIFTFSLLVLLSFVFAGWFTYLLVYWITRSNPAAIFSGIIFAFCPYHFARSWQHLALSQIQWMPLYLLSLFSLKDKPGAKNTLLATLALFLVISCNFYYAYLMAIATFGFLMFAVVREKKNPKQVFNFYLKFCIVSLIALILIFPSLWEAYKTKGQISDETPLEHNITHRPFEDLFIQSAKPLSYLLPATAHPLFGKFSECLIGSSLYGQSLTEHTLYLGWAPLILAFIAFKRRGRLRKAQSDNFYISFFVLLAVTAWIFSQPPWWDIFGFKLYMPAFFMYKILPMFRAYCRFGIVMMLAVAVLAGFGLKFILERFKSQKTKVAVTALFCALVLFEFWNYPPFKVIDLSKVPQVYYWLKEQPGGIVIAEYPLDAGSPNELYKFFQTVHEKKIINGTTPGTHANKVAQAIRRLSEPHTAGILKWMGVKYVLAHKEDYLKTDLIEDRQDLEEFPKNPELKFVKSFPPQECPDKDIMCAQKTGQIDIYEVVAQPKEPSCKINARNDVKCNKVKN